MDKKYKVTSDETGFTVEISRNINKEEIAIDSIISGLLDVGVQQLQGMDALMTGISDLFAEINTLKTDVENLKDKGGNNVG